MTPLKFSATNSASETRSQTPEVRRQTSDLRFRASDSFADEMSRALGSPGRDDGGASPSSGQTREKRRVSPARAGNEITDHQAAQMVAAHANCPPAVGAPSEFQQRQDSAGGNGSPSLPPVSAEDSAITEADVTETGNGSPPAAAQNESAIALKAATQPKPAGETTPSPTDPATPDASNAAADLELLALPAEPELETPADDTVTNLPPVVGATEGKSAKKEGERDHGDEKHPETSEKSDGISVAKLLSPMKKGIQSNEITEHDEQILPVALDEANWDFAARPARLAGLPEWNLNLATVSQPELQRADTAAISFMLPALSSPASTLALERTQEMISAHALRFKQSEDGSLQVVIRPADGLQLSLDVRRVAGGIEVRAELNQGDHSFLSRHWADLQQQLESRGIRLGALIGDQTSGQAGEWSQRQPETADEFSQTAPLAIHAAKSNPGPVRLAVNRAGWEFWA